MAVLATENKATIQCNNYNALENSMLVYDIYNMETLEKLINTAHNIHNTASSHEKLLAEQQSSLTVKFLYVYSLVYTITP